VVGCGGLGGRVIQPLQITTGSLTPGEQDKPYAQTLTVTGGVAPYNWSVSTGTLPPGVTMNANGNLSGTPTAVGTFSFAVTVTDANRLTASGNFDVTVNAQPPQITTGRLPQGQQGNTYSQVFTATGGTPPYTWSVSAGTPPPGVTMNANGNLSGTPTAAGTFSFTVTVTDANRLTASGNFGITVNIGLGGQKINHVVIIFQENRTPDNLFHDSVLISRGADIASQGQTSSGTIVQLTPVPLVTAYDLGHSHDSFLRACDYSSATNTCAMDGADTDQCFPSQNCPAYPEYQYVQQSDVQPYFTMAETYTFGDHMFQSNQGPSFPAHQYIISGTSRIDAASALSVADNPSNYVRPDGQYWAGCLAPPGSRVHAIDISQPSPETPLTLITQMCFEHPTLTDLLDGANLSWKYYAPTAGSIWTAPNSIQHMCVPSGPPDATVCSGPDWTNPNPNVVIEGSGAQIISDISGGGLAAVSWVIPNGAASDHAHDNTGLGPSWVAAIVNAIGQSPYWADTAIIITWDDWGGWYDHVSPSKIRNSYEVGLRVPLIVISPYAKPAYISQANHDFGSILKFTETVFGLGEINPTVGYADSESDDLSDCFDFSQTPLVFTPIRAPRTKNYFLNDKSPPTPPDND
jgi:phospholipase C